MNVVAQDGIVFDAASARVDEICKNAGCAGTRVIVSAELARARCKTQIDSVAHKRFAYHSGGSSSTLSPAP